MKVTVPFWFYCKLVRSNVEKHLDKLDKLFTLQNIANLQGIGFTLDFGFKIYRDLTESAPFPLGFTRCISLYIYVVLSFRKIFFPHPYSLLLAVNKSLAVFILSHALDGLQKENRGSVDRLALYLLKNDETNPEYQKIK